MKITLFTSNQPRHIALARALQSIATDLHIIVESSTVFPGTGKGIHRQSDTMARYMDKVREAESKVFGSVGFFPESAKVMVLQFGDLRRLGPQDLGAAKDSNVFVSFGCGFIKGPLFDYLESKRALNIHMGISPQFRGSSCNFWAVHDGHPDKVGATIHLLGRELDAGEILFHALPAARVADSFLLGMLAVKAAHGGLVDWIKDGKIFRESPVPQDRSKEIRYSVGADFTDEIAEQALAHPLSATEIGRRMEARNMADFIRPWIQT